MARTRQTARKSTGGRVDVVRGKGGRGLGGGRGGRGGRGGSNSEDEVRRERKKIKVSNPSPQQQVAQIFACQYCDIVENSVDELGLHILTSHNDQMDEEGNSVETVLLKYKQQVPVNHANDSEEEAEEDQEQDVEEPNLPELDLDTIVETSFNAHFFDTGGEAKDTFSPWVVGAVSVNPITGVKEKYIGFSFNSKYDGKGIEIHGR